MRQAMQFKHEGKTYEIDFTRQRREVTVVTKTGEEKRQSTYPYTTVKILEVNPEQPRNKWNVFRISTVGCWHREQRPNRNTGRVRAMRSLFVPTTMKAPMWAAYHSRTGVKPKQEPKVS